MSRANILPGYWYDRLAVNQIHFPDSRWTNLQVEHELYCHGHLIEAGVSHHEATRRSDLLEIARRAADRIVADFKGKGPEHTPGHQEIEIALLRLYQLTGQADYLDMARQFISNVSRTWTDLGKYVYTYDERNVWMHQYVNSEAVLEECGVVKLKIETGLPRQGNVRIGVTIDPTSLVEHFDPDLLGGTSVLSAKFLDYAPLISTLYCLWGNRGPSQMTVWVNA
jgi:DUF1680 family protein